MRQIVCCALIWLTAVLVGCRAGDGKLTEVQRVRSGPFDVVLLSETGSLRHGQDDFVVEFRSATDGSLIDVGTVKSSASMSMSGTPMLGTVDVERTSVAGRYAAKGELSMAGTWRMSMEWEGPAGKGSASFSSAVN